MGSLFQTWDAVDEKDFEVVIDVSLNGADMVMEEGNQSDREGVYLGCQKWILGWRKSDLRGRMHWKLALCSEGK